MIDLKRYVCGLPFTNVELHKGASFLCCPSWLRKRLPNNAKLNTIWNSDEAKTIRKSVLDGTYIHCDKTQCPYLSELLNVGDKGEIGPIVPIATNPAFLKSYNHQTGEMLQNPEYVQFSFDRTCNLKCPSCRIEIFVANSNQIKEVGATIEEIEETFANDVKTLYITGSGDPFVSVGFRNFLRKFNPKKYPKLETIHLHTNATMWNKEMWDSMPNIHRYVKTCEISIDAGTSKTYENYTRIGGNWKILIDNLKFINTIPTLTYIKPSFVVQSHNYTEMETFVTLMKSIFGKKAHIYFGKILNWGHMSSSQYELSKIWDTSHPEYSNFLTEFNKIAKDYQVFHNMQEFMNFKKTLV